MDSATSPEEFLRFLVASFVSNPAAVSVTRQDDSLGTLLLLEVSPSDMGTLIGRGGKTVDAIRTVLRVFGAKSELRLNLKLVE